MPIEFAGNGEPITAEGFTASVSKLGIEPAALWSVVAVETSGCGFLADRRPKILFERHIFHKETASRFDAQAPDISNEDPGGYGASGANQYVRLAKAIALDRNAALHSASWGLGQVMGFNAVKAGYADVEAMIAAMSGSEDAHLMAMANFIQSIGLDAALRGKDWAKFAEGYNGRNYRDNDYDGKLDRNFTHYAAGNAPNLMVRAAQVYLMYLGQNPGPIDGVLGRRTIDALKAIGLSAIVDASTIADLKAKLG